MKSNDVAMKMLLCIGESAKALLRFRKTLTSTVEHMMYAGTVGLKVIFDIYNRLTRLQMMIMLMFPVIGIPVIVKRSDLRIVSRHLPVWGISCQYLEVLGNVATLP